MAFVDLPAPLREEYLLGGKRLVVSSGHLAKQAAGSCTVSLQDTSVLAAVTASKKPRQGLPDFVPLTVDYREKTYAAGRIPGGFFKREGRPRDKEILSSRLTDRSLRPLFPEGFSYDIMVQILTLSSDQENDSDLLAILAASTSLVLSDLPFLGPVAAVRLGRLENRWTLNPTFAERQESSVDLVIAGTKNGIVLVEGGGDEIEENLFLEAFEFAQEPIRQLCDLQLRLLQKRSPVKRPLPSPETPAGLENAVMEKALAPLREALRKHLPKQELDGAVQNLRGEILAALAETFPGMDAAIQKSLEDLLYREIRTMTLEGLRADGRRWDEIRPISIEVPALARTHGSALFTRGQTQALATVTLGTPQDMQIMDQLEGEYKERFLFHYNFPGFSTGEVKPERGPGRREIGHGALARRALEPLLPEEEVFPYTIRLVSDILESNGSSSMASTCGGSLALFQAGVPLKAPCAGIAMGLVLEGDKYAILSDITGLEDHFGDMDFKVAGTARGITAFQMDVKIESVPIPILKEALLQAQKGRRLILEKMNAALPTPQ
ncbi:MAG: polyribonucleotide nucleotidyltransferase, partial [Elusimicrobia bacterium]|nr:polyribonucleotide nucleotidyltransferase [Elusimicrobiota bacterium]